MISRFLAALLLASLLAHPIRADEPQAAGGTVGAVVVSGAYARPSMGAGSVSAAFMTITLSGERSDRLVAASSPSARATELHDHVMSDGVMRMRPVESIPILPGTPTVLAPGGLHLMLIGSEPLAVGDSVHVVLEFAENGSLALDLPVRALRGPGSGGGHGQGGHGQGGHGQGGHGQDGHGQGHRQ